MSGDRTTTQGLGLPGRGIDDVPRLQDEDRHVLRGAGGESTAGSGGDQGSTLARAAALRFPDLKDKHPRERVDLLIDYISETAIARGDLEELRLEAHVRLREARQELDRVPTGVTRNKASIDEAKRRATPDAARAHDGAGWLVGRCTDQINRLERDYDAASRAYTLISGS